MIEILAELCEELDSTDPEAFRFLSSYIAGSPVDEAMLIAALDFFLSIEPRHELGEDMDTYEQRLEEFKTEVNAANEVIRQFGRQIRPLTLERMQEIYYAVTRSPKYTQSVEHNSIATSILNHEWHGVGPWVR